MTTTDVAQLEPAQTVIAKIRSDDFRQDLAAALPEGVSVDRFTRVVATALMDDAARTRDPAKRLTSADRISLYQAVIKCAQDGLLPDGREAALVKRGDSVSYMPMVGGLRKIAGEHGWAITARVVCANDDFENVEEPPSIRHAPVRPGTERGEFIAAYAVARHKDGRRVQRVLYADEIRKRMAVATTTNVWNAWEEQMWEKTVARDVFADLPFDESETDRVMRIVNEFEPGEAARALYGPAVDEASPEPRPAEDQHESAAALADSQHGGVQEPEAAAPSPQEILDQVDDAEFSDIDDIPFGNSPAGVPTVDPAFQALADAAAQYQPKGRQWPTEMTLEQIHAEGEQGVKYLVWCRDNIKKAEFKAALDDYMRVYMPAEYQAAAAMEELS